MRPRVALFALLIAVGCTPQSAPSGEAAHDVDGEDTPECPDDSERSGDGCASADEPDTGMRRVPVLGSGNPLPEASTSARPEDAGGDAALDPGDAGRRNSASDGGTSGSMDAAAGDAGDAGNDSAASDATLVDPTTTCAQSSNRLAVAGDDELSYTGPGLIKEGWTLAPMSFNTDDAGLMLSATFSRRGDDWLPRFSAYELDAGFSPGIYMATATRWPGQAQFSLGDNTVCNDILLEIFQIEVSPRDVDAGKPAQLKTLHARFDRHCYDGTRYDYLVGCLRYVAP